MKKLFGIIFLACIAVVVLACSYTPVDVESFQYNPDVKTQIYSSDGKVIAELYDENRTYVEIEDIPDDLINAVVAVEDERFYDHSGYDLIGIFRATWQNVKNKEITEGASTITQQLARNLFDEITTEQTLTRKIKEILTAREIEGKYSKDQIIEMYLNEIYLGSGVFGVQEASRKFLGKDVSDLTLAESALIAGLPQAPSAYAPDKNFELAKKRQEVVLDRMVSNEYITEDEAEEAKREEISIVEHEATISNDKKYSAFVNRVVDEFTEYLKEEYPDKDISRDDVVGILKNEGFKVKTTINSQIQAKAVESLNMGIKSHNLADVATGAIVTVDWNTGQVLAYYGGNTDIDMAGKPRQPGSTIKPLIYSKAFEDGIVTSNSLIKDEPFNYNGWQPKNSDGKFRGYITVREALVDSINIPAAKIAIEMGIDDTIQHIKSFGITTVSDEDYGNPAISLGGLTYGVSPLEMAQAYSVFANGGVLNRVYFIESIEDESRNVIYSRGNEQSKRRQIIDPNSADEIKELLTDVVERGTGSRAFNRYETGGKTGTSDDNRDLWFNGFTGNTTTSIWLGNVDNEPLNGKSAYSAEIYANYVNDLTMSSLIDEGYLVESTRDDMSTITIISPEAKGDVHEGITEEDVITIEVPKTEEDFFKSNMVTKVAVDIETNKVFVEGRCPVENKEEKYYLVGTEPTEYCSEFHLFEKLKNLMEKK